MTDDPWLLVAARVDAFRIVPRLIIAAYGGFFIKAWVMVFTWFAAFDWTTLPNDPVVGAVAAAAVAGFPAVILGIMTNVLFKLITEKWGTQE